MSGDLRGLRFDVSKFRKESIEFFIRCTSRAAAQSVEISGPEPLGEPYFEEEPGTGEIGTSDPGCRHLAQYKTRSARETEKYTTHV